MVHVASEVRVGKCGTLGAHNTLPVSTKEESGYGRAIQVDQVVAHPAGSGLWSVVNGPGWHRNTQDH
jgi:hypothetical protein